MTTISKRIRNGIMEGWSSDAHCLDGEIAKEAVDTIDALVAALENVLPTLDDLAKYRGLSYSEAQSLAADARAALAKAKGKQE